MTSPEIQTLCERSIILAASSVAKLRKDDVWRVMADFQHGHGDVSQLVGYIIENRPDLKLEAETCEAELKTEAIRE